MKDKTTKGKDDRQIKSNQSVEGHVFCSEVLSKNLWSSLQLK